MTPDGVQLNHVRVPLQHLGPTTNLIAAGQGLILGTIVSYGLMHVFFFGVPHFTLATRMGKGEIFYALSNLVLIGIGLYSILRGRRERRS